MKLRSVLFFALIFLSFANVCLAQAGVEPPVSEEPAKEEPIAEPPAQEAPPTEQAVEPEKPAKKKKKKKSEETEEAVSEEHATGEPVKEKKAVSEESPKKKKKKKKDEPAPPQEGDVPHEQLAPEQEGLAPEETSPDQAAPAEPAKLEDDGKKDTWFRIFKMKRCPIKSCDTKMVHTHEGKKFRGVKKMKIIQNPKTGELVRKPVTDPREHKKSPKVRKKREYQKEFKLPKKHN